MNTGSTIARLRRHPEHCLYCADPAVSDEHVLQKAIGGRLTAPILCTRHNNGIGSVADDALFESLRPLVNMLRIKRHDRSVGATYKARTTTGEHVTVTENQRHVIPLDVQRDGRNRIIGGTGPLDLVEQLRSAGALSDHSADSIIATVVKPPAVYFGVGSDAMAEAAVLKTAIHFIAGFVGDIPLEQAQRLLPYVMGRNRAIDEFVGRAPFNDTITPDGWPPFHQVTCWTAADATYVAVMLFGAHPYLCRLPFRMPNMAALRYRQPLVGARLDPVLEENVTVSGVDWNMKVTQDEANAWGTEILRRMNRIGQWAQAREFTEQAERVGRRAEQLAMGGGDFWEHYRAQLQLEALSADEIDEFIQVGRAARAQGREVWEFAVEFRATPTG